MSLKIDEYLSSVGALAPSSAQNMNVSSDAQKTEFEQRDSYTASEINSGAAVPCDNYNDILKIIQKSKAESLDIDTSQESLDKSVKKLLSDESDDSEENEATQKIVTINGVTYLETTVVIDGIKVVTRTAIRGEKIPDIDQIGGPNDDISIPSNLSNS